MTHEPSTNSTPKFLPEMVIDSTLSICITCEFAGARVQIKIDGNRDLRSQPFHTYLIDAVRTSFISNDETLDGFALSFGAACLFGSNFLAHDVIICDFRFGHRNDERKPRAMPAGMNRFWNSRWQLSVSFPIGANCWITLFHLPICLIL